MEETNSYLVAWQGKVRDYECDAKGVVHHPVYSQYLDEARKEFLASLKLDLVSLAKSDFHLSVMKFDVRYCSSLTRNDEFVVVTKMKRTSKMQLHFNQHIYRLPDRTLIAKCTNISRLINIKGNCPGWPETLEMLLTEYPSPE